MQNRAVVIVGILSLIAMGCQPPTVAPPPAQEKQAAPGAVATVKPERKQLRRVIEQPGAVHAYEETRLFARIPGYVAKVHADIGAKVQVGQVLAEISAPEMEEEVQHKRALTRQAEAGVEQAKKTFAAMDAGVATADAQVAEAKANFQRWESEAKRIAGLVASGVIDAQTRDEATHQYRASAARVQSTEAAVKKAKADRDRAAADIQFEEARVSVAQADTRRLEAMLAYAKIRAPFDGVVTARKVNTGDFVQPATGKGDWLFTVDRLDPVRVIVAVPEADASLVQEKVPVKLVIRAAQELAMDASITRISWALEANSRTLRAEVDLPNPDARLRPGMYVYAHIVGQLAESWVLPASAVTKQGGVMIAYRVEGDKALATPIQVGKTDGTSIEVLRRQKQASPATWENIAAEDIFAAQAAGLTDGQPIRR